MKGLKFLDTGLSMSHQKFMDDNILFGHPSFQEARAFKSLLNTFSEASGTSVNPAKSQIFFFNTPAITQASIARILGFSIAYLPAKYLGAPLIDSAINNSSWNILLEKLEARLSSWNFRALNMASRLVLIKFVLQPMPLYLFSVLAAPKWVLKQIKVLQRRFLWGSSGQNRKWALVNSNTIFTPKEAGGLELRDPTHSNIVMGGRLWWKWTSNPSTPWAKLWNAKYANNWPPEELIRLFPAVPDSLIWTAAKQHNDLIQQHSFWEIRNGGTAKFWTDAW